MKGGRLNVVDGLATLLSTRLYGRELNAVTFGWWQHLAAVFTQILLTPER